MLAKYNSLEKQKSNCDWNNNSRNERLTGYKNVTFQVYQNIPSYLASKIISRIISGELSNDNESVAEWTPEDISGLKYAPIMSTGVERSFSKQNADAA